MTNFMQQSPVWATDINSAGQEIPRLLRNPKVHYRTHKSANGTHPDLAESSPHPHTLFVKIDFDITCPLRLGLPFTFPTT